MSDGMTRNHGDENSVQIGTEEILHYEYVNLEKSFW